MPPAPLIPGLRMGELLGEGTTGTVYAAVNSRGEELAVKFLRESLASDAEMVSRFRREASIAQKLRSDFIARVVGAGRTESRYWIAYRRLHGDTLASRLQRDRVLEPAAVVPIIDQVLQGLAVAHEAGVVHRDIKPGNILIERPNKKGGAGWSCGDARPWSSVCAKARWGWRSGRWPGRCEAGRRSRRARSWRSPRAPSVRDSRQGLTLPRAGRRPDRGPRGRNGLGSRAMRSVAAAALLIAGVTGCEFNLAAVSSGQIGCAESDITISGDTSEYHTRTWIADCNGKTYYCSAAGGGHSLVVSCHLPESASRPASAPPQVAGCTYDTQCKGDRICKAGRCVDPAQKISPEGGATTP